MNHQDQVKWNNRYRESGLDYSLLKPSDWLVKHKDILQTAQPGQALDIACGSGRNSFYLADLGFTVESIDISDVAIDWLSEEVNKRGHSIIPVQDNLENIL